MAAKHCTPSSGARCTADGMDRSAASLRRSLCALAHPSALPPSCAGGVRTPLSTRRQTDTAVHACKPPWKTMGNVVQTAVCAMVQASRRLSSACGTAKISAAPL